MAAESSASAGHARVPVFASEDRWTPRKGPVEQFAQIVCQIALAVLMVMVSVEVALRATTGFSLELADELGGYILVALTFFSLSICQVEHAFHRVEFVQARLSARGRAWSELGFDLLALGFTAILAWQFIRLEMIGFASGDVAPTFLVTPLWIPQLSMALGTVFLLWTLLRTVIADLSRLAALREPSRGKGT